MKDNATQISKFLSYVLRHEPEAIGLSLDVNGWANIDELIAKSTAKGTVFTREELDSVVAHNDKKRFVINSDGTKIRASQGHSITVELNLQQVVPPEILYHGTAERFRPAIYQEGLRKMERQHVHLSKERETAYQVGIRYGKPVILEIEAGRMHRDGFTFFLSENGVYLTDHVPVKYFKDEDTKRSV